MGRQAAMLDRVRSACRIEPAPVVMLLAASVVEQLMAQDEAGALDSASFPNRYVYQRDSASLPVWCVDAVNGRQILELTLLQAAA